MKHHPKLLTSLVGAALMAGCSSTPPLQQAQIVPFSEIRDAADSADGFYALGRELQRSGKLDDAERAYRRALELEPSHVEAHNGLAAVSAGRGDLDLAIAILTKLAAQRPDQAHVQGNLGYANYLKGNYFDARVALERAVALDPANVRLQEKLAMVMQKLDPQAIPVPAAQIEQLAVSPATVSAPFPQDRIVELSPGVHVLQFADATPVHPVAAASPVSAPATVPATVVTERPRPQDKPEAGRRAAVTDLVADAGRQARVEIVNGNGIAGLARSVHQIVQSGDWQVVRLGNQGKFNVQLTRIEYAKGNRQVARLLAKELHIAPVYWHNEALGDRVRVVLGHDLRNLKLPRSQVALAVQSSAS